MIFSALKTWRERKSNPPLHTITVIESDRLPFSLGQEIAKVTGRKHFDSPNPPRIGLKVVSRPSDFVVSSEKQKLLGIILRVDEILESPSLQSLGNLDFSSSEIRGQILLLALKKIREC